MVVGPQLVLALCLGLLGLPKKETQAPQGALLGVAGAVEQRAARLCLERAHVVKSV